MPFSTYELPVTSNKAPVRYYIGTTPVKGVFRYKYDSTNIKDGHYQVYPNIYTLTLSNYNSISGDAAGYYDNIMIDFDLSAIQWGGLILLLLATIMHFLSYMTCLCLT